MKKKIIVSIIILVAGYLLGSFFPFPLNTSFLQSDIRGDAELRVTILRDNGQPVPNLEVDVAEETGPPPKGGIFETDENGLATFFIKPGVYSVYFNMGTFPGDLQPLPQGSKRIKVELGKINEETIILTSK